MLTISALLQSEPLDTQALNAQLEELGLTNPPEPPLKTLPKRRFVSTYKSATSAPAGSTTSRAEKLIEGLAKAPEDQAALQDVLDDLLLDISRAADPFRSLLNFSRLCDGVADRAAFFHELQQHPPLRARLVRLMSFSQAMTETLLGEPALMEELRHPTGVVSRAELRQRAHKVLLSQETQAAKLDALRRFRRRETLRIGLLDMESQTWRVDNDFESVVHQISDLAQVVVQETLCVLTDQSTLSGFCVLGMGKLGARELNYSSDIDLIFLHDGETAQMDKIGQALFKELGAQTPAGQLWRTDMRLRPEGAAGPLVSPLGYALSYYESYAAPWEWQALIKCRVLAGDAKLGRRFRKFTRGISWAKRTDDSHLRSVVEMKRRSETTDDGSNQANVKQGPGGIRDAEWVVQQLQMMVGPQHPRARAKDSLRAIEVLQSFDALSRQEALALREGYLFLRVLEHRLQLWEERAVRDIPDWMPEQAALARRMGCLSRGEAAARWLQEEHTRHRTDVRALCEHLFWGWRDTTESGEENETQDQSRTGTAISASDVSHAALSTDAQKRLKRLAEGSPTHPFPAPLARQIHIALPDALRHLEHAAQPERALVNLERLCDTSGNRLSLLRSLGQSPELSRAVFAILGGSQSLSDTLIRHPELLDMAANRPLLSHPKSWDEARSDCRSYCMTFRDRRAALRRWKRREMLRIGLRDLALDAPPTEIVAEISDLCRASLDLAVDEVGAQLRPDSSRIGFAVLGMGKLGGGEMHYGSDADVLFVYDAYDGFPGSGEIAAKWANELIKYMGERTEDGTVFEVDARLRPEGRTGAIAPPLEGYLKYFERTSGGVAVWERQALTRARGVAGDPLAGASLLATVRHVAFPESWQAAWSDELRHIKSRVENERGSKSTFVRVYDVKLGHGGLSDIEWTAQWLAMKHGDKFPELQTPNTLRQATAAKESGLLSEPELQTLIDGYNFLRRAELRLQITQEHSSSVVKAGTPEFRSWTRAIFPDETNEVAVERFEEGWQHHTTGVRAVMERVRNEL
jgi:glutamate-ammonia-ligase adenylyltransferase